MLVSRLSSKVLQYVRRSQNLNCIRFAATAKVNEEIPAHQNDSSLTNSGSPLLTQEKAAIFAKNEGTYYVVGVQGQHVIVKDNILLNRSVLAKERIAEHFKLDTADWSDVNFKLRDLPAYYASLSKIRLTGLVVITQLGGYLLAPGAVNLSVLGFATLGTALTSASANTLNQFLEVPYDSQMSRTSQRVLVRRKLSSLHALGFAAFCGTSGASLLYFGVNPLTSALGVFNLLVYVCAYTPMKRLSTANTWIGSVCGAVPPMMGWAAATNAVEPGALLLGALLYCWQFPHFNALSWRLRPDYARAGYRMLAVTDAPMLRRVALRHSVALTALSCAAPWLDITSWWFLLPALPINGTLCWLSWKFYREKDARSARVLFRYSLAHIALLMLAMGLTQHKVLDYCFSPAISVSEL